MSQLPQIASLLAVLRLFPGHDLQAGEHDFGHIATLVRAAISRGELPGAVVLILHRDRIVYHEGFGDRAIKPARVPASITTLYDLASLTKPLVTATAIMMLWEQKRISLDEAAGGRWPAFAANGKHEIRIADLLLHTSGLIADNPIDDYRGGRTLALQNICNLRPLAPPGQRFIYSDVNYIVLGELVERLSGLALDQFAAQKILAPLGMQNTHFRLPSMAMAKVATTTKRDGRWLQGEVHDPRAALMGGVAGHAGLFSTAHDLSRYCRMILNGGVLEGRRILAEATVRAMVKPRQVPGGLRSYGWDVDTRFSTNRGNLFPRGKSFGHTGFTGTSIWIDPGSQTALIFLSNRIHPDGKGNVNRLRGDVATAAAKALRIERAP